MPSCKTHAQAPALIAVPAPAHTAPSTSSTRLSIPSAVTPAPQPHDTSSPRRPAPVVARNANGDCPITMEPLSTLSDVIIAQDNFAYSRPALRAHFMTAQNDHSPMTREPMPKDRKDLVNFKRGFVPSSTYLLSNFHFIAGALTLASGGVSVGVSTAVLNAIESSYPSEGNIPNSYKALGLGLGVVSGIWLSIGSYKFLRNRAKSATTRAMAQVDLEMQVLTPEA